MNSHGPKTHIDSKPLEIRQAGPQQFDELLILVSEFHQIEKLPFSVPGTGAALGQLLENHQLGFVLISMEASVMTGYILVTFGYSLEFGGRDAFVDELYVRLPFQRKGIGTALLLEAEKLALKLGVNALHLESDFDNYIATSLYESKAYQRHLRFLMTKWLNPTGNLKTSS